HMTQPPLSQTIAALEETLGAPLFLRTRRQVELTPAGAALLPEARDGLRQRRLGHVQALGGAAEMQFFGHGNEIAQLA
ncbi:MAG TPA: hypothetical protein DDZ22_14005, partial [Massilia sp.]|nr:hypothetical protein [Massilia sp.]